MKINKIIFGATAMLTMGMLASCSNDEPAPGNGNEQGGATRYMAVRIQSVPDLGSRGTQVVEDGATFEEGDGNESGVLKDDVRFFFFDKDGNPYTVNTIVVNGTVTGESNMVKPTSLADITETPGNPTKMEGVLVLNIPEGKVTVPPAKVICVANIDEADDYANKTISAIQALEHKQAETSENDKFAMTSSTYMEGTNIVNYTDITGKLQTSPEAATANPAEIYLERLAVKIRPNSAETFSREYTVKRKEGNTLTDDDFQFNQNGQTIKLCVELTGWAPYNTASSAYSLKKIQNTWTDADLFAGWNNASLHRCYWAEVPTLTLGNTSYDLASADGFTTGTWYTYENTSDDNTKMIVRGVVYAKGDATKTGIDFVKWGGYYYTYEAFIDLVAADQNVTDKTTIELVEDALANTYKVQVDGKDVPAFTGIYWWKKGVTSYVVNIEHLGDKLAVVRNHIYDYDFNALIGLGIPGNIPEQPTQTNTYLAAKIYVLDWRLVNKTITLN